MALQLAYTSVPKGLLPGTEGFSTVGMTAKMPAPIREKLESFCAYKELFPANDPNAAKNPIAVHHVIVNVNGRSWNMLGRIAPAGVDYTGRANKFAAWLALDATDLNSAGPAWTATQPGVLPTAWTGTARMIETPNIPVGEAPARPCAHWANLTGDSGWAGVLARAALDQTPTYVIYPTGYDPLPLLAEAMALLPTDQRWHVSFSTYYAGFGPGVSCIWRCVPEAVAANIHREGAKVIDLTQPTSAPDTPDTDSARNGRPLPVRVTTKTVPILQPLSFDSVAGREAKPSKSTSLTSDSKPPRYQPPQRSQRSPLTFVLPVVGLALGLLLAGGAIGAWESMSGKNLARMFGNERANAEKEDLEKQFAEWKSLLDSADRRAKEVQKNAEANAALADKEREKLTQELENRTKQMREIEGELNQKITRVAELEVSLAAEREALKLASSKPDTTVPKVIVKEPIKNPIEVKITPTSHIGGMLIATPLNLAPSTNLQIPKEKGAESQTRDLRPLVPNIDSIEVKVTWELLMSHTSSGINESERPHELKIIPKPSQGGNTEFSATVRPKEGEAFELATLKYDSGKLTFAWREPTIQSAMKEYAQAIIRNSIVVLHTKSGNVLFSLGNPQTLSWKLNGSPYPLFPVLSESRQHKDHAMGILIDQYRDLFTIPGLPTSNATRHLLIETTFGTVTSSKPNLDVKTPNHPRQFPINTDITLVSAKEDTKVCWIGIRHMGPVYKNGLGEPKLKKDPNPDEKKAFDSQLAEWKKNEEKKKFNPDLGSPNIEKILLLSKCEAIQAYVILAEWHTNGSPKSP